MGHGHAAALADQLPHRGGVGCGRAGQQRHAILQRPDQLGHHPPSTYWFGFRYNSRWLLLQSRPSPAYNNAAHVLKATLRNTSGAAARSLAIRYDQGLWDTERGELPGLYVYYSLSGESNSWVKIPELSGIEADASLAANVELNGLWAPDTDLYLLWVDDEADGVTDEAYTIDNISFLPGPATGVWITRPGHGAVLSQGESISLRASAALPGAIQNVAFFTGTTFIGGDPVAPYEVLWTNASLGPHALTAVAHDDQGNRATSAVVQITVLPPPCKPGDRFQFSVETPGGGKVTRVPLSDAYPCGTEVTTMATAALGWQFLGWLGDLANSNWVATVAVTENKCATAVFGTPLSLAVSGAGTASAQPAAPAYPCGLPVRLVARPDAGHYFAGWAGVPDALANPASLVVDRVAPAVTAHFAALDAGQVALAVVPEGFGRVTTAPRANVYPVGTLVTNLAVPAPGQTFLGWGGTPTTRSWTAPCWWLPWTPAASSTRSLPGSPGWKWRGAWAR